MNKNLAFFQRHPSYFIDIISVNYPFSISQLRDYRANLNWELVSKNTNIVWDSDILKEFDLHLDWFYLTINSSAFKNLNLLDEFSHKIEWEGPENYYGDSIASNKGLHWDINFIEKYQTKISFEKLSTNTSVKWSSDLIERFATKWDYKELIKNISVPWTLSMIEKYIDIKLLTNRFISPKSSIYGNLEIVEKYQTTLSWFSICANSNLPWKERNLLDYWRSRIDWRGIALNEGLFLDDKDFFNNNLYQWSKKNNEAFHWLSSNEALPWTKSFIDTFKEVWDWESICLNEGIPWSIDIIDSFEKYVRWGGYIPGPLEDTEGNVISLTEGETLLFGLFENKSLPWSIDFIEYYESKIDFEALKYNTAVWDKALKPIINDEFIEMMMRSN